MGQQDTRYKASKVRSQGRPGWSVSFRHPLRRDNRDRPGLKVRRGLGTSDDAEADHLVEQLQKLINDPSWHHIDRRREAQRTFDPPVVSAFYDGLEAGSENPEEWRETSIPLPTRKEGYSRVMLVGTTGAGKTTLLRHIIGTDHVRDRFPATSTARTTIADMEIVVAPGPYAAVVTFTPEHIVRGVIDECVESACLAALDDQPDDKIADKLLSHPEQRFRLSYTLGEWKPKNAEEEWNYSFKGTDTKEEGIDEGETVTERDALANQLRLETYVARIKRLARLAGEVLENSEAGPRPAQTSTSSEKAEDANWLELYSEVVLDLDEFSQIALDIKDAVESRFDTLPFGEIEKGPSGWPKYWHFSSDDRDLFLKQVRWFTSNHSQQFGRLLTPLVNGLRVRGPFEPLIPELRGKRRLVMLDGQGLGHVAEVSPSISTNVTHKFPDVDLILLVDSAQQPMQAAPITLLKAVASAGHGDRLAIAFTHFDQVKGDNLQTFSQKRSHVLAAVTNALAFLRQNVPAGVIDLLRAALDSRCFLLGGLDGPIFELPPGILQQFQRMLVLMQHPVETKEAKGLAPIYAFTGLELAVRDAVEGFMKPWEARLGFTYRDGIQKEHWARIKALSRRFAMNWGNEYDNLRPAADLVTQLQEQISRWLDEPIDWTIKPKNLEEREASLDRIRRSVSQELHRLVQGRLADKPRPEWREAYRFHSTGSALQRAEKVKDIYQGSAPQISSAMLKPAREFLDEVKTIVAAAVESSGGQIRWSHAA